MKLISDLNIAINKQSFYEDQFKGLAKKHILFMTCQLSKKDLYTKILPFINMYDVNDTITALIGINKYNPEDQLTEIDLFFNNITDIMWADVIVIPFTTKPLKPFYDKVREVNPGVKIVFWVDFNYYELPPTHPYKKIFTTEAIETVEDNIWMADMCKVSSVALHRYLSHKLANEVAKNRLKNVPSTVEIQCQPILIDINSFLENVDYDPQQPIANNQKKKGRKNEITQTAQENGKLMVVCQKGKWVHKKSKNAAALQEFTNKKQAVEAAQESIKKGVHVIVYTKDGKVHFQKNQPKNK